MRQYFFSGMHFGNRDFVVLITCFCSPPTFLPNGSAISPRMCSNGGFHYVYYFKASVFAFPFSIFLLSFSNHPSLFPHTFQADCRGLWLLQR